MAPTVVPVFAAYATALEEPWNTVIHNALLEARDEGRIRYTWADKLGYAGELTDAIGLAAADGARVVFTDGYGNEQRLEDMARALTFVRFVIGMDRVPTGHNCTVFDSGGTEPAYLCGLIAGRMTKTKTIGVVAGIPSPSVNRVLHAFLQGAKEERPQNRVKIVSLDSWYDPPAAGAAAKKLVDGGADIVFAERSGAIEGVKDRDVLFFGNLLDRHDHAPGKVITGPIWRINPVVDHVLKQYPQGLRQAEDLRKLSTLAGGGADLADWHGWDKKLPPEVLQLVEEKKARLRDGKFHLTVSDQAPKGD